jgi:hypothetical protein
VLGDGTEDAEYQGQRPGRAEVAVIGLAAGELPTEVADDRPVKVAAGVIECGGDVLQLVQVTGRQRIRSVAGRDWLAAGQLIEQAGQAVCARRLHVDRQQHRAAVQEHRQCQR